MNIKLLKSINRMKAFTKWLDTNRVHVALWSEYNPLGKIYKGLEKRERISLNRDAFCFTRSKDRNTFLDTYSRLGQFTKAQQLLNYGKARHERKK